MENLIKKIRAVEPTKEQLKDRTPEYAFGWVDSLNAITEVVKNNVDLHNVSNQREQFFALLKYAMPTNYKDLALERIVERFINESK